MLYKILYNINLPLRCKLPQFAKPICFTQHIVQQNNRAFVSIRYNTYQISWRFTYSIAQLWNGLPNEAVLAVKQDHFIALAKNFCLLIIWILSWMTLLTHP